MHQSKNRAMRLKEQPAELRDRIMSAQIWGRLQKNYVALKVTKSTVASIIRPGLFPELAHSAKLSNRGRRALVRQVSNNPMVSLPELHWSCVEIAETSRRTIITETLLRGGLYGRVARRKPLLIERHVKAHLEFAKKHLELLLKRLQHKKCEKSEGVWILSECTVQYVHQLCSHVKKWINKIKTALKASLCFWFLKCEKDPQLLVRVGALQEWKLIYVTVQLQRQNDRVATVINYEYIYEAESCHRPLFSLVILYSVHDVADNNSNAT